jgi:hypothetical protein
MLAYTGWCLAEIERDMPRAEAMLLEARSLAARVGQDLLDVQSGLGLCATMRQIGKAHGCT